MSKQIFKKPYNCLTAIALCFSLQITNKAYAEQNYSPTLTGFLGLNTVPSARMDKVGTIRTGISALDPYMHGYIGLQIAQPLYINIRQSAETTGITKTANHLYPGVDLKLRLLKETAHRPEISLGLQSAFGHKKMASEYIALSKRYNNFDFTAGIGWGKMSGAGKLNNPLKGISSHFAKNRNPNSESPNEPHNWFSGDTIGFFAGLEYFTPIDGLSLKLDYGADNYSAEQNSLNYNPPSPWGTGLAYTYNNWASASVGIQGLDKVMGHISLQSSPEKWWFKGKKYNKPKPFYKERSGILNITAIKQAAENDNIILSNISTNNKSIFATLEITPNAPTPKQIGRALRLIAANSGYNIEEINITPIHTNLHGRTVKIMRSDVENSIINNNSSPQEIWKNTEFTVTDDNNIHSHNLETKRISNKNTIALSLENQISLSEEDSGILYRSSAFIESKSNPFMGFVTGSKLRVNLNDNLDKIHKLRPAALNPVRSDIYEFTDKLISLDNAYVGYKYSLNPDLHASITGGYLEEFYTGIGGEVLYRPFASRFAFGAEIWRVSRRNPYTALNLGADTDNVTSGHINTWYDLPHHNITLSARAGQYLAGDVGGSIGLVKTFKNGAKLDTSVTITNYSDPDLFGGTTHAYHSLKLSLPLGSIPYINEGSAINTTIAPFGRDIGQSINPPSRLYEMTDNFTLNHIANHWREILD